MEMMQDDEFEWLCSYEELGPKLREVVSASGRSFEGSSCLVLGCGRSRLSKDIAEVEKVKHVHSIDRDPEIIQSMSRREPELGWQVAELNEVSGVFDFCFDKSTSDAVAAECGHAAEVALCAIRCLAPGGIYIVISLYPGELIEPLFADGDFFSLVEPSFRVGKGEKATVAVFQRTRHASYSHHEAFRLRQRQGHLFDAWFFERQPLLTPQRRLDLEKRWRQFSPNLSHLHSEAAYFVLFADTPLSELYDLQAFQSDLAAFFLARRRMKQMKNDQPKDEDDATTTFSSCTTTMMEYDDDDDDDDNATVVTVASSCHDTIFFDFSTALHFLLEMQ